MYTYEETKEMAVETIIHGALTIGLTKDHDTVKELAESIQSAAKLVMYLEDLQVAFEKGDLEGMDKAATKYGF